MSALRELLRLAGKAAQVVAWRIRLAPARWRRRSVLVFELQLPGHWDYVDGVIAALARVPSFVVLVTPMAEEQARVAGSLRRPRGVGVVSHGLLKWIGRIDAYLSLTQYTLGVPANARTSVLIPHGLPSKGNSVIAGCFGFDHVFLTGPMLEEMYCKRMSRPLPGGARRPSLHRAGYPKSDRHLSRPAPPPDRGGHRVVLFAPSYERHTSLFAYGEAILDRLLAVERTEIWVKLHPMLFHGDWIRRCGENWSARLAAAFGANPRVRLLPPDTGDEVLLEAGALVTDVSGVAYEFILLGRGPVIYLECPDFYRVTAPQLWEPGATVEELGESVFVGREYGLVVEPEGLPEAVRFAIDQPEHRREERQRLIDRLVFNPGAGTSAYVRLIREIVDGQYDRREPQVPS